MAYRIIFTATAKKDITRLDSVIQKRLWKKLIEVSECADIKLLAKRLVGTGTSEYRLRIGDYRVIFDLDKKTLYILRVRHRRNVYR